MRTHLAVSFRSQRSDAMENYVVSLIGKNEIHNFAEKREKRLEKCTTHHSQQCNLLNDQQFTNAGLVL